MGKFLSLLLLIAATPLQAQTLTVSYIEKPPYYYTEGGTARGFLLDFTKQMADKAGLAITLSARPAKRVLSELQANASPMCSIGWFKTPEREAFARFSLPIHQDTPMAVLTDLAHEEQIRRFPSLRALTADPAYRLGVSDGFSYGVYVDALVHEMGANLERAAITPVQTLKKLAMGRIAYTIVDTEELEYLAREANLARHRLVAIHFPDIPPGNIRYLMCSHRVDDALLARINDAIRAMQAAK